MPSVASYTHLGGRHAETASLTNLLRAQGVVAPHDGRPYSEAMLLGVGGGLGAGYILWEFKEHHATVLVLGWRNRWQYPIQWYETVCGRIDADATFDETGSPRTAAAQLDAAVDAGHPVIAWVDRAQMPYLELPRALEGHIGHLVAIYGVEDGDVLVDDLAAAPFRVPVGTMAAARARIRSYRNRLLVVDAGDATDLPAAITAGIEDQIEHLGGGSDSFSLPTFRKWSRMMTNRTNAKGWPQVFAERRGLFGALRSVFEGVELVSTGGGGMRGLYAEFLDEAAPIIDCPALHEVADGYRRLAARWSAFADSALPDSVEPFRDMKRLLRQRHERLMTEGGRALEQTRLLTELLDAIHVRCSRDFPMDDREISELFTSMGDELMALYDAEVATLATLRATST